MDQGQGSALEPEVAMDIGHEDSEKGPPDENSESDKQHDDNVVMVCV